MTEEERNQSASAAAGGDRDALQRLLVYYHPPLRRRVRQAIEPSLRPFLEPEDVLQETYITAFQKITECRFDGAGGFYKWLEGIALNTVRDEQKALIAGKRNVNRRAPRPRWSASSYLSLLDWVAASDTSPSGRKRREEAIGAVTAALARLPPVQRDVIRLRILGGQPARSVAVALNRSEDAVNAALSRGLRSLRHLLTLTGTFSFSK